MENIQLYRNKCELTFELRKNVKTQTCDVWTSQVFYEYYESYIEPKLINVFLLLETCFDSAFGH
jgi:hypothetical protein